MAHGMSRSASRAGLVLLAVKLGLVCPASAQETLDGCGMSGTARNLGVQALDRLKNRYSASAVRR